MSKPIFELIDELPTDNMTVKALNALDFVVPGEWNNLVGFKETIRAVTGETDPELVKAIGDRAVWLFNDKSQGYQRALWLYQITDSYDRAIGAAAIANKVSGKIPLMGFLGNITPKADTVQTVDLCLKLVVELIAFCQINGIPGDSIGDFVASLADYGGESLMRMAALVCFDALIPLGPDFISIAQSKLNTLSPNDLANNPVFQQVKDLIPGSNPTNQLNFIGESFDSARGWMSGFVSQRGLSVEKVMGSLRNVIEFSDSKLDYVAAFLDMATNYYEHTGTQTLARRLIERAVAEV